MLREGVRLPGEDDDIRRLVGFGDPEGGAISVDDKHAGSGTAKFGVPGLAWLPGRGERKREADDAGRDDLTRGSAGDPPPVRATALDERQPYTAPRGLPPQRVDELQPRAVLLRRGPGRASAPDPV